MKNAGTPRDFTYTSWRAMLYRCKSTNENDRKYYFDKGITVCDEWQKSFNTFLNDMGLRPKGKTLDRIDSNGNYEPSNCRWATASEQALNSSRARKEIKCQYEPCSKIFMYNTKRQKFCSSKCLGLYNHFIATGMHDRVYTCQYCFKKYNYIKSNQIYCSKSCANYVRHQTKRELSKSLETTT